MDAPILDLDSGAAAGAYVDAFMQAIDWAGVDARFLIGGLDGWRAQGRPAVTKPLG